MRWPGRLQRGDEVSETPGPPLAARSVVGDQPVTNGLRAARDASCHDGPGSWGIGRAQPRWCVWHPSAGSPEGCSMPVAGPARTPLTSPRWGCRPRVQVRDGTGLRVVPDAGLGQALAPTHPGLSLGRSLPRFSPRARRPGRGAAGGRVPVGSHLDAAESYNPAAESGR